MSKNTETRLNEKVGDIKFVGQPIFKQIIGLLDAINLKSITIKHNTDYYYKAFKAKNTIDNNAFWYSKPM